MSVSTVQKITFISCLVLCVSLFLPKMFLSRGQKEIVQSEVGPGHFPPLRYSQPFSEDYDHWQVEPHYGKSYNPEAFSRSKGAGKPNLLGQVIPVYGFGIFLYIIYIFVKLSQKDRSTKAECRFPIWTAEFTMQEIPDYEMTQLQARLRQMEGVRERRASKAVHPPARSRRGSRRREQRKIRQMRDITRVMLEGRPLEGVSPEVEAEETPYSVDWEGYPEETYPRYEVTFRRRRYPSVILEEPDTDAPTAEELAERMEREEEEEEVEEEEDDSINEELEEFEHGLDEDLQYATENSPTESRCDGKTKETEDRDDDSDSDDDEGEDGEDQEGVEEEEEEDAYVEELENNDDICHLEVQTQEEEEEEEDEEEVGEDEPCLPRNRSDEDEGDTRKAREKKQITFSAHRRVFHYPKGGSVSCTYKDEEMKENANEESEDEEDEEDEEEEEEEGDEEEKQEEDGEMEAVVREEVDPLREAESLAFHSEGESDPDEQELDLLDFLLSYQAEATGHFSQSTAPRSPVPATLRMRHKQQKKKN